MNTAQNGKGSRDRTTDKKAYDECPIWNNWQTKAKNERIYNEGKDKLDGTGIEIIKEKGE